MVICFKGLAIVFTDSKRCMSSPNHRPIQILPSAHLFKSLAFLTRFVQIQVQPLYQALLLNRLLVAFAQPYFQKKNHLTSS